MNKQVICGVAARSGGHLIPCITLIKNQVKDSNNPTVLFFTTHTKLDSMIKSQFPWITHNISLHLDNIPYKKPWLLPLFILQFIKSFLTALFYFIKMRPEKIITTGGYLSIPVCLAGRFLFIPIELFELNAIPGRASKVIAYMTHSISICFSSASQYFSKKTSLKPYPLQFSKEIIKDNNTKKNNTKKRILILGGSQGSSFLNTQLYRTITLFAPYIENITHQAGNNTISELESFYTTIGIKFTVFSYKQNLSSYYQEADIIICRSGAGTLFEVLFFNKRCITIPLETASTSHQLNNALEIQKQSPKLFTVIRQKDLLQDETILFNTLLHLSS